MKVIKYIFLGLFPFCQLFSQNSLTNSPYSMFGLGEIFPKTYGQNSAMGGVSYGMRDSWLLNTNNPAGLTGLDSSRIFMETSAFFKNEHYKSNGDSNDAYTSNFSAFTLAGRVMPRWFIAAGITPFSSVGYYFNSIQNIEGSPNSYTNSTFEGDGGLSKVTLSNALLLSKNISLGVNLSYVFGSMTQKETQGSMVTEQKMSTNTFYADFGIQYFRPLSKNTFLTLGAVYGYKQKLTLDNKFAVVGSLTGMEVKKQKTTQYLPQFIGIGGSLQHKKWTYALDYSFHEYSVINSGDERISFEDVHDIRAGIDYFPNGYSSQSIWKRTHYKIGTNVYTPYFSINDKKGIAWRVSAGFDMPVFNGRINTSVFYDKTQLKDKAFQKDVIGFVITYTISEKIYKIRL